MRLRRFITIFAVGPLPSYIRVINANEGIQKKVCILCYNLCAIKAVMK